VHSYLLYFFLWNTSAGIGQSIEPQAFATRESCEYAAHLIVSDLKSKMPGFSIQSYCVPQDIKESK
jgi:hypothetical protein